MVKMPKSKLALAPTLTLTVLVNIRKGQTVALSSKPAISKSFSKMQFRSFQVVRMAT